MKNLTRGLLGFFILLGCQTQAPTVSKALSASLSVQAQWQNLKRAPQWAPGFRTQALDVLQIAQADAHLSGPGLTAPLPPRSPENPFALPQGNGSPVIHFDNVPLGANRVVTVQARDRNGEILAGYVIKGVLNVQAGENQLRISPATTATAEIIEALMAQGSELAATVNHQALQGLVDDLIDNQTPESDDDVPPGLINASAIAQALVADAGAVPAFDRARFVLTGSNLRVTLTGLGESYLLKGQNRVVFPPLRLSLGDPASETLVVPAQNESGSRGDVTYTINNIRGGGTYTLEINPDYHRPRSQQISIAAGQTLSISANFTAADKRHYFQEAVEGSGREIRRYQNGEVLDILIIKPSNPAADANGWDANTHLNAVNTAIDQLRRYFPMISVGVVDEVFDTDPDFNLLPMPPLGGSFNALPGNSTSPNAPENQGPAPAGHLVGRYDLYLRWRTDFCSTSPNTLGVCRHSFASLTDDTYINSIELAVRTCEGEIVDFDNAVSIAAHEMMHALGTSGHSSLESDLMAQQLNLSKPLQLRPNVRDIFTLRLLYDAEASKFNRPHTP